MDQVVAEADKEERQRMLPARVVWLVLFSGRLTRRSPACWPGGWAASYGHLEQLRWSDSWPQVTFALEDRRHLTRRLEHDLLAARQRVVPTGLQAAPRRSGRQPGKSDPIDA